MMRVRVCGTMFHNMYWDIDFFAKRQVITRRGGSSGLKENSEAHQFIAGPVSIARTSSDLLLRHLGSSECLEIFFARLISQLLHLLPGLYGSTSFTTSHLIGLECWDWGRSPILCTLIGRWCFCVSLFWSCFCGQSTCFWSCWLTLCTFFFLLLVVRVALYTKDCWQLP